MTFRCRLTIWRILTAERFLYRFRIRGLEWFLAVMMTAIGFELVRQAPDFNEAAFQAVKVIDNELAWGIGCLLLGGLRLAVLLVNGSLPRGSPHLRGLFALASLGVFVKLWTEYGDAAFPTLMPAVLLVMAVFEGVNLKRTAQDAATEDKGHSGGQAIGMV